MRGRIPLGTGFCGTGSGNFIYYLGIKDFAKFLSLGSNKVETG